MAVISQNIDLACELILAGELVAIPTETVYGLAGNALNTDAILKIYSAKSRPKFNPLITHIGKIEQISQIAREIPQLAYDFFEKYSPGPITLLLPKAEIIPDMLTAGSDKVAVRIPNHPLSLELLQRCDLPLAAPSANPFGYVSPTNPQHVESQLGDKIKLILDGGECQVGIESTIVEILPNKVLFHRLGAITPEMVLQDFPNIEIVIANEGRERPVAPGQLKSHYAPNKTCLIGNFDELVAEHSTNKLGAIRFSDYSNLLPIGNQIILAKDSRLETAAKNLFSSLRQVESLDCDLIIIEPLPNQGIGRAVNDRLKRASKSG